MAETWIVNVRNNTGHKHLAAAEMKICDQIMQGEAQLVKQLKEINKVFNFMAQFAEKVGADQSAVFNFRLAFLTHFDELFGSLRVIDSRFHNEEDSLMGIQHRIITKRAALTNCKMSALESAELHKLVLSAKTQRAHIIHMTIQLQHAKEKEAKAVIKEIKASAAVIASAAFFPPALHKTGIAAIKATITLVQAELELQKKKDQLKTVTNNRNVRIKRLAALRQKQAQVQTAPQQIKELITLCSGLEARFKKLVILAEFTHHVRLLVNKLHIGTKSLKASLDKYGQCPASEKVAARREVLKAAQSLHNMWKVQKASPLGVFILSVNNKTSLQIMQIIERDHANL